MTDLGPLPPVESPLAAARGIMSGLVLAAVVWGTALAIVWWVRG